jgi:hypothetical protein
MSNSGTTQSSIAERLLLTRDDIVLVGERGITVIRVRPTMSADEFATRATRPVSGTAAIVAVCFTLAILALGFLVAHYL